MWRKQSELYLKYARLARLAPSKALHNAGQRPERDAQDINDGGQIAAQAISTNPQNHTEYDVLLNPTTNGLLG